VPEAIFASRNDLRGTTEAEMTPKPPDPPGKMRGRPGRPPVNGVPHREIGEALGITEHAVRYALKDGRLVPNQAGVLTVETARAQYAMSANPARPEHADELAPIPFPEEEDAAALTDLPPGTFPPGTTFAAIRIAHEQVKVRERSLRVQEREGQLVDRARALALVQAFAQEERDAVLSLPSRVAGVMAAAIGCDPHALQTQLETMLRNHLAERNAADPRVSGLKAAAAKAVRTRVF
jgi:hypothetical protein